jgi:hypothetical protein
MNIEKQLASYKNIKGLFSSPKIFLIGKEMPIHIGENLMVLNLQVANKCYKKLFELNLRNDVNINKPKAF